MLWVWWLGLTMVGAHAAILPPPWADPEINPCATQPGGWLKLYWPQDGKCYRIFQRGSPCPDTMELSPGPGGAECKCPPGQVQLTEGSPCHRIHTRGPCPRGQYLAPLQHSTKGRWGGCRSLPQCHEDGQLFWPATGKCYQEFARGPCPVGQLLMFNNGTNLAECGCSSTGVLSRFYWRATKSCHQFYTRGPCLEKGALFLPGPKCGCHSKLTNYHSNTEQCYEIGSSGPCKSGHIFQVQDQGESAQCVCKPEHVPWQDGHCYRLYTQGPCSQGQLVSLDGVCKDVPCPRGKLYFPENDTCHRVGVRGPCSKGQLVLFEQSVRPSVEGISYRGMCGCSGSEECREETFESQGRNKNQSEAKVGPTKPTRQAHIDYSSASLCQNIGGIEMCHKLYTQGPCQQGEWLVPYRQSRAKRRASKMVIPGAIGVYIGVRLSPTASSSSTTTFEAEPQALINTETPLQDAAPLYQPDPVPQKAEARIFQDTVRERRQMARCECRTGYSRGEHGCQLPLIALAKYLNGADYFQ